MMVCFGSSMAAVRARKSRSHEMPSSFGATVKRISRSGSGTEMEMGPIVVSRPSGMAPEAKIECSTPSTMTLKAASITPRLG